MNNSPHKRRIHGDFQLSGTIFEATLQTAGCPWVPESEQGTSVERLSALHRFIRKKETVPRHSGREVLHPSEGIVWRATQEKHCEGFESAVCRSPSCICNASSSVVVCVCSLPCLLFPPLCDLCRWMHHLFLQKHLSLNLRYFCVGGWRVVWWLKVFMSSVFSSNECEHFLVIGASTQIYDESPPLESAVLSLILPHSLVWCIRRNVWVWWVTEIVLVFRFIC